MKYNQRSWGLHTMKDISYRMKYNQRSWGYTRWKIFHIEWNIIKDHEVTHDKIKRERKRKTKDRGDNSSMGLVSSLGSLPWI